MKSGFDDGETVTLATGTGTTVMVEVPVFPSLVAVIVAVPSATAVTRPVAETDAVPFALELQLTDRSVTVVPFRSFTVAVSWAVVPMMTFGAFGATETDATGTGSTVTVDVPLLPSAVAVIVAVPGVTPVTTPADDTVAIASLLELHATVRSVTVVPAMSLTVTVSVVVCVAITDAVVGVTATEPTARIGARTLMFAVPLLPSL